MYRRRSIIVTVSQQLENFLNFYNQAKYDYQTAYENVNRCDKLTQDLLHKLELDDLTTSEKNRVATQLKYCRKDRRYWKDIVEELEPFIDIFTPGKNNTAAGHIKTINLLSEALGKVRRQEAYHSDRRYKPRIIISES